jgi:hypothetical protein
MAQIVLTSPQVGSKRRGFGSVPMVRPGRDRYHLYWTEGHDLAIPACRVLTWPFPVSSPGSEGWRIDTNMT